MNKEQEKQLTWKQIQDKEEEIKQNKAKLEILEKELDNLKNEYSYLTAADDAQIFLDVN